VKLNKKSQEDSHDFLPESLLGLCFVIMQMFAQITKSSLWHPEIFVKEMIVSVYIYFQLSLISISFYLPFLLGEGRGEGLKE